MLWQNSKMDPGILSPAVRTLVPVKSAILECEWDLGGQFMPLLRLGYATMARRRDFAGVFTVSNELMVSSLEGRLCWVQPNQGHPVKDSLEAES